MVYLIKKPEIEKFLNEKKLTGEFTFLHEYHDRYLVDSAFPDRDVVPIALFLREGTGHNTQVYKVKSTYISLGRSERSWENAVTEAVRWNYVGIYKDKDTKEDHVRLLISGLKRIEDICGKASVSRLYIIKSGATFTAKKLFEDFLKAGIEKGEILLCDPYISPSTLYPFSELWGKIDSLKILTSNISEKDKLHTCIKGLEDERGIEVEVKVNLKIHDRYLISENKCWVIGTSIKDLGNKDCVIKEMTEIRQSLVDLFWERWKDST